MIERAEVAHKHGPVAERPHARDGRGLWRNQCPRWLRPELVLMLSVVKSARHSALLGATAEGGAGAGQLASRHHQASSIATGRPRRGGPRLGSPATLPGPRGLQRILRGALISLPDTAGWEWGPQPREGRRVLYTINDNLRPFFFIAKENKVLISTTRITICITWLVMSCNWSRWD